MEVFREISGEIKIFGAFCKEIPGSISKLILRGIADEIPWCRKEFVKESLQGILNF